MTPIQPDPETDAEQLPTIEYWVCSPTMDTVRQHRWEPDGDGGVLSTKREWAWDYVADAYHERGNTHTFDVTPDGTVEHTGQSLAEYARERVDVLTRKRFPSTDVDECYTVRTE